MLGTAMMGVPRERATESAIMSGPPWRPCTWAANVLRVAGATNTPSTSSS